MQSSNGARGNFARILLRLQFGIAVTIVIRQIRDQIVAPMRDQFGSGGRAEANGVGHARVAHRDAVMSKARGHIEDVAGVKQPFLGGLEVCQQAQVVVRQEASGFIALLADLPAALAQALDQEYIIVIEMRPHSAAVAGGANHDIVDPPVGHEAEWFDQRGDFGHMMIDRLHQQRPGRLVELAEAYFREGPVLGRHCFIGLRD